MRSERSFRQGFIPYRVRQFWDALYSTPPAELDLALARLVLTEQQIPLFTRLQPDEQAHGLRVLKALQDQGETHPDLLVAALLHDIGKIYHPLRIWERVLIVLAKQLFPKQMLAWGQAQPLGWKRPFVIACLHPQWGAELAQEAGANPLAVDLIRNHQKVLSTQTANTEESRLLSALQRADNQN